MPATSVATRSFRNLEDAELGLAPGLTVLAGPNGAGKTNLLEAVFFGLTGASPRTSRDRELIAFGSDVARVEVVVESAGDELIFAAAVGRSEGKVRQLDGSPLTAADDRRRPAVSVFMPDRLALVKGAPGPRRAYLDRLVAAVWPARAGARAEYRRTLAQRNALLGRLRAGAGLPDSLDPWDRAFAAAAAQLTAARAQAAEELAPHFELAAVQLGLEGEAGLRYRPRVEEADPEAIIAELGARREGDVLRGYSGWGPHLDELVLSRDGREIRRYASQGEQRLAMLALLFAERASLLAARRSLPLMLLDDVMSELDPGRRGNLIEMLDDGQAVITATEPGHVPGGDLVLAVAAGEIGEPEA